MGRMTEMFEAQKDREHNVALLVSSSQAEIVTCPKCHGTNIVPDINADGSFGAMWCVACKHEFDRPADRVYIKGLLYIVAIMIIAAAAFYGQEEIKAIWRDVVDLIGK